MRSAHLQPDLQHVVHQYQNDGIVISLCADDDTIRQIQATKPHRFESLLYRTRVLAGLTRNPVGGFGTIIPYPTQSSRFGFNFG